jgi:hypothetical protein
MTNEQIYILEVVYEQVVETGDGRHLELAVDSFTFKNASKDIAKRDVDREFDRILRYGLKKSGGSIIKLIIPPSSIKNIGIVDYNKWVEEQQLMSQSNEEINSSQTSEVTDSGESDK